MTSLWCDFQFLPLCVLTVFCEPMLWNPCRSNFSLSSFSLSTRVKGKGKEARGWTLTSSVLGSSSQDFQDLMEETSRKGQWINIDKMSDKLCWFTHHGSKEKVCLEIVLTFKEDIGVCLFLFFFCEVFFFLYNI